MPTREVVTVLGPAPVGWLWLVSAPALFGAGGDVSPLGDTWSLSGPSSADGVLYHPSAREVVAVGQK